MNDLMFTNSDEWLKVEDTIKHTLVYQIMLKNN